MNRETINWLTFKLLDTFSFSVISTFDIDVVILDDKVSPSEDKLAFLFDSK